MTTEFKLPGRPSQGLVGNFLSLFILIM